MTDQVWDPKGLIRESYNIDGIDDSQCRSIFLDWALGVPLDSDPHELIRDLLEKYRPDHPHHPMTDVLRHGLFSDQDPKRRGGWRSRKRP